MQKRMLLLGLVLSETFMIIGCANNGDAKVITINAINYEFDQKEIILKKGETVSMKLKNNKGYHTVRVDGYDKEINPYKTVTFTADQVGKFEYRCSTMCGKGHADMVGAIIVEE